ncbi:tyrosine-type recombinase/integrase [Nocardia shimofusensis]|uniref:tyrosine-type recombinase/integrase n=1 Tax=Nocardia shimofusensis TaxID=228596 RepID=UPI00083692F1|nr:site-specific integrase [Nocardia shimofusensis]
MNGELDAALRLISAHLGAHEPQDADDLRPPTLPTFSEYIAHLRTALPATTVRNYSSYWVVVEQEWAERRLDEPTATEISDLVQRHRRRAAVRSNSRGGRGAVMNMVSALRCVYRHAELDGLLTEKENPARRVARPRRLASPRHALTREQIIELGRVAATTGNDTELDALIVRLHVETACRRGGVLGLEVGDLDREDCLIRLHEKGETVRWQPVSPLLMTKLVEHVEHRGGEATTRKVLRYRSGRAITGRRYDYLIDRVRTHLPWAARLQVTPHWIRHTTLTFVEREFGEAVARAYAGHAPSGPSGATPIYTRAGIVEVAEALVAVTGQPHPLARAVRYPLAPTDPREGIV